MERFKPISWTVGEGGEFEATLTATPDNEESDWGGRITFKNDRYNWPVELDTKTVFYQPWFYPGRKAGGTYMLNLLMGWHEEIVAFIKRMRGE